MKSPVIPCSKIVEDRVVRDEDEQSEEDSKDDDVSAALGIFDSLDTDSACEDMSDNEDENTSSGESILPENLLRKLSPRSFNLIIRGFSGIGLISGFAGLVCMGPFGLLLLSYLVLIKSFSEVMKLGFQQCHVRDRRTQRYCWYLLFLLNYALEARHVFPVVIHGVEPLQYTSVTSLLLGLIRYHTAIVFALYLAGIAWFVTSMKTTNYLGRYALFGWCHTVLVLMVLPITLIDRTLFTDGMVHYISAVIIIAINDISAYYVGFFFGKTPLIKLSPKKTLEGYIGGGFLTLIIGPLFVAFCLNFPSLLCPAKVNASYITQILQKMSYSSEPLISVDTQCNMSPMFVPATYEFMSFNWTVAPYILHGLAISVFASILGPFAGFLASGFKRACNRKNFGSLIPGHGGVVDRCDCMFLMAGFIYVYLDSIR